MEDCGAPTVECCSSGKATCTIDTIIRRPGVEHAGILAFHFCILFLLRHRL
jgi:hypothetical protein